MANPRPARAECPICQSGRVVEINRAIVRGASSFEVADGVRPPRVVVDWHICRHMSESYYADAGMTRAQQNESWYRAHARLLAAGVNPRCL